MSDANDTIIRARLAIHGLSDPRFTAPEDVVRFFGAVQSQEYAVAKWSLAQRCSGVAQADVDRAIADGRILRTHVLRPTWHFVAREDIRWLLAATGARVQRGNASRYRQLEIDEGVLRKSRAILAKELRDGGHRTRSEIGTALQRGGITAAGPRLAHIVMHAELHGLICSGVPVGRQNTYALLDERAPNTDLPGEDDSIARLVVRYFTSHGPATVKDFCWWSGLTLRTARRGLETAGRLLERATIDSVEYWHAPDLPDPSSGAQAAHLLQAFDEYVVAYSESRTLAARPGISALPGPGESRHTVLLDGRVMGRWRSIAKRGGHVEFDIEKGVSAAARQALTDAIARYYAFIGREPMAKP